MPDPNDHLDQSELLGAVDALLSEVDQVSSAYAESEPLEDQDGLVTDEGYSAPIPTPAQTEDTTEDKTQDTPEDQTAEADTTEAEPEAVVADPGAAALEAVENLESSIDELVEATQTDSQDAAQDDSEPEPDAAVDTDEESDPDDTAEAQAEPESEQAPDAPAVETGEQSVAPAEPEDAEAEAEAAAGDDDDDDENETDPVAEPDAGSADTQPEVGPETEAETEPVAEAAADEPAPESEHDAEAQDDAVAEAEAEAEAEPLSSEELESSMDVLDAALDDLDKLAESAEPEAADAAEAEATEEPESETDPDPQPGASEPEPTPPAEAPSDTDSDALLDAALDDLMGNDTSSEALDAPEPVAAATPEPTPTHDATPEPTPQAEPAATTTEPVQAAAATTPTAPRVQIPEWFDNAVEAARPRLDKIDPKDGKCVDALAMALGWTIGATTLYVPIGAQRVSAVVSKPLAKQPHSVRNAIGWVALWTAFLAVVTWGYILFVHTPPVPEPTQAPSRVLESSSTPNDTPALP